MAEWTRTPPTEEGWYFWRRAKTTRDTSRWRSLYVVNECPYKGTDREVAGWCGWEGGTAVEWPKGGWWLHIYGSKEEVVRERISGPIPVRRKRPTG